MDDTSATAATLDQADEEILTYTVSDEALEAAADTGSRASLVGNNPSLWCCSVYHCTV
jgi:hypothetical protein